MLLRSCQHTPRGQKSYAQKARGGDDADIPLWKTRSDMLYSAQRETRDAVSSTPEQAWTGLNHLDESRTVNRERRQHTMAHNTDGQRAGTAPIERGRDRERERERGRERPTTDPVTPGAQAPQASQAITPEEATRVKHWRAFLVYLFPDYFWLTPAYEVRAIRYGEWSRATGVPEQTLKSWYERGSTPNSESVVRLARLCGVLPQAILYHAGKLSIEDLAVYLGPQSLHLLDEEEYQREVAANEAYQHDETARAAWREHLDRCLTHTHDLQRQLQLAPDDWAELRDELNSPAGQERLREEIAGQPSVTGILPAPRPAPRGYYLPAEFTGGDTLAFAPPQQRARKPSAVAPERSGRPSTRERVASRPRGGRPHTRR